MDQSPKCRDGRNTEQQSLLISLIRSRLCWLLICQARRAATRCIPYCGEMYRLAGSVSSSPFSLTVICNNVFLQYRTPLERTYQTGHPIQSSLIRYSNLKPTLPRSSSSIISGSTRRTLSLVSSLVWAFPTLRSSLGHFPSRIRLRQIRRVYNLLLKLSSAQGRLLRARASMTSSAR